MQLRANSSWVGGMGSKHALKHCTYFLAASLWAGALQDDVLNHYTGSKRFSPRPPQLNSEVT